MRRGRAEEFADHGWSAQQVPDPQSPATRDASVLDWDELADGDHARMLAFYRDLIALRRAEPDLREDDLSRVAVTVGAGWVIQHRGRFDIAVNLSGGAAVLPVRPGADVVLSWSERRPAQARGRWHAPGRGRGG